MSLATESAALSMPPLSAGYPARGRWLTDALMAVLKISENRAGGFVGNCGFESEGLIPGDQEKNPIAGEGGLGWAQWTGSRRRNFVGFCASNGLDVHSDVGNYEFLIHEIQFEQVGQITMRALLAAPDTLAAAVFAVGRLFETPAGTTSNHLPGFAERLKRAEDAIAGQRIGGGPPLQPAPEPAPGPAPAPPAGESDPDAPFRRQQIAAIVAAFNASAAALQLALWNEGYLGDETDDDSWKAVVDGDWGPASRAALLQWLKDSSPPAGTSAPDPAGTGAKAQG